MPDEPTSPLTAMLGMIDTLSPIFEMAKGVKVQLEADGWSPTAAEDVARELMCGVIRSAFHK